MGTEKEPRQGYWDYEKGEVVVLRDEDKPPVSSLVAAFQRQEDIAADAIVLRGFLGQSDVVRRTLNYLKRAKALQANPVLAGVEGFAEDVEQTKEGGLAAALEAHGLKRESTTGGSEPGPIDAFALSLTEFAEKAPEEIPWRLYLTPRLDTYVDFHRKSLLAVRREPASERQDTVTVWLRAFEEGSRLPVPYRVVQETIVGPAFTAYLGGDVIDDYLGPSGSGSSAWGDQSSVFGRKPGTGTVCGAFERKPGTGTVCGG